MCFVFENELFWGVGAGAIDDVDLGSKPLHLATPVLTINVTRTLAALAGFDLDEIDITAQENTLLITGEKKTSGEADTNYLHRGIAARNFEQRFKLADYVEVKAAALQNGMLSIHLEREIPERMKPRQIEIKSGGLMEKVKKLTKSDKKAA